MKVVLILGGWHASAIWFFKVHGQGGEYRLWVGDCWSGSACRFSKSCEKFFLLPSFHNEEEYISRLIEIYKKHRFDALIPLPHEEVLLVSKYRSILQEAGVPVVITNYGSMQIAADKEKLGIFCNKYGIPYPLTFAGDKYTGIQMLEKASLPFIVKLKNSTNQVDQRICHTRDLFLSYLDRMFLKHGEHNVIVQQFVSGYELDSMYTCGVFCGRAHNILGVYPTKKIRSRPYSGGAGICTRTTRDPKVEEICLKAVSALGDWVGICNIEVKRDFNTGKYYLIEINPRAWGSPMLSITLSGIDLIDMWIRITLNDDMPENIAPGREGVYSTELFHDLILLTDLLKDLPFKTKRQKALESLMSYRFPYLYNSRGVSLYQSIADFDIYDFRIFLKKTVRLKKRLIQAFTPSNRGRKEGEYLDI